MKKIGIVLLLLALCLPAQAVTYQAPNGLPVILAVGGSFAYARDNQGKIYVWGDNQYGQLGRGDTRQSFKVGTFETKNQAIDLSRLKDIIPASDYSFLLMDDSTVYGVGNNSYLPLTRKGSPHKTHVLAELNVALADMKTGFGHVLALTDEGEVYAWGRNNRGQVGNGNRKNVMTPYKLPLQNIVKIECGGKYSLALDDQGVLWGWGDNEYNQLSPKKQIDFTTPVQIQYGEIDIQQLEANGASVVLLDTKGVLWTWGRNDMHQLGYDTKGQTTTVPGPVPLPGKVTYVAAYSSQTYAILEGGALWSWGNNSYGQLGQGFRSAASKGVLPGLAWEKDIVMVMGGSLFVVAMTEDGSLLTAGISKFGQQARGDGKSVYTLSETGIDLILP
jgi:alpha-tubulin suppressor-like RCC1 family protein